MKLFAACSLVTLSLYAGEDDWALNNSFAIWADAAFYRRSEGSKRDLVFDLGNGKPDSCGNCHFPVCTSRQLVRHFHFEPGYRIGTAYMSNHTWLEATYLWLNDWESACHRKDPGFISFTKDRSFGQDYQKADEASAHYKSRFRNGELNYFRYVTPRKGNFFSGAWLVGARYIFLADTLNLTYHKGANRSSYDINTWNHLYMLQVGGGLSWNPIRTISWDFAAKVGSGINYNRQHTFLGDLNNTLILRDYSKERYSVPFFTDASLELVYQPWEFFNMHIGYQVIFLNEIAAAPNQISKSHSDDHQLHSKTYCIIHGGTVGIALSF